MAAKESDIHIDMTRDMESESVTLSEQDRKLLRAFHDLRLQPEIESAEDLASFLRKCDLSKGKDTGSEIPGTSVDRNCHSLEDKGFGRTPHATVMTPYQYPRISTFGGDSGKGEVTWECFRFEVESLQADGVYMPEQILHGIRKAAKGEVAEIIRRLGTGVSVHDVMEKLNSTYGNIETRETIMKKFYSCVQQAGETVTAYASRLEEYFDKAAALGGLNRRDTQILKGVLYQGLRRDIKQLSTYKCDTIHDYDRFKIEVRKIEAEMKEESRPCRPAVQEPVTKEKVERSEMSEVKELLKSLNDRIRQLEESKEEATANTYRFSRGARRGYRGGGKGRGYGGFVVRDADSRNTRNMGRPVAGTTFSPTCWRCNKKGHVQTNCPN